jgi:hypothetical protein
MGSRRAAGPHAAARSGLDAIEHGAGLGSGRASSLPDFRAVCPQSATQAAATWRSGTRAAVRYHRSTSEALTQVGPTGTSRPLGASPCPPQRHETNRGRRYQQYQQPMGIPGAQHGIQNYPGAGWNAENSESNQEIRSVGWAVKRSCRKIKWCPGAESNHRHCDFQSHALPTELPGRTMSVQEAGCLAHGRRWIKPPPDREHGNGVFKRFARGRAAGLRPVPWAGLECGKRRSASGRDRLPGSAACRTASWLPRSAGCKLGRSMVA